MTRPLIILYRVVQQINSGMVDHELPPLSGGSREVNLCHAQFAKLIKVVRISNIAYYSGALQRSLEFISDALALFRRVNDEKAIGIACNNLGNTLFAMAKEADSEDLSIFQTGMAHYNESIAISQRNFVTATDEIDKSDYAQQLADRLFNRSIFSLLAHSLGSASDVIRDSALEDLRHVRELDYDTKDYWIDRKLLLKNSDKCFSRLLRRIHGLVDFYDDEQVIELWDPKELINEADNLLFAAWNQPSAGLFEKFTPVGRLQQLEDAAMRLDLLVGKKANAARLAMRILVEDEFVLESVFATAAKSLVEFLHDEASASWSSKTKLSCRQDLRRMALHCKNRSVDLSKNVLFALEINECFECDPILEKIRENCFGLYTNYCSSDDHVGVVAYTVDGDLNVELGSKEENESRQRYGLDLATTSTGDCVSPTLHYATQMVIDCPCSENDTYIILISDGYSWDPASFAAARKQIEQLNKDRGSTIHLLILGLEVEESEAVENYMAICSFTKLSWYADISMENIDMTFRTVGDIISGRSLTATRSQCLTMERF